MITAATLYRVAAIQQRRDLAQIRSRRDALAAQREQAIAQYNQLEQTLNELRRTLDAMHGGLQELDALIAEIQLPSGTERRTPNDDSLTR